jgi:hypothetical protein
MSGPTPWKRGADPELRALMEHAAAEGPSAAQLAALSASVKAELAQAAGASSGVSVGVKLPWAALGAGAALGSALVACAALLWGRPTQHLPAVQQHDPQLPASLQPALRQPAPGLALAPLDGDEPRPSAPAPAAPHGAPAQRRRTRSAPARAPAPTADAPLARAVTPEPTLLLRARSALAAHDLATARDALAEHARDHAEGQFREEREALAIELLALSRDEPALRARAASFAARYPHSPYRERLFRYWPK